MKQTEQGARKDSTIEYKIHLANNQSINQFNKCESITPYRYNIKTSNQLN